MLGIFLMGFIIGTLLGFGTCVAIYFHNRRHCGKKHGFLHIGNSHLLADDSLLKERRDHSVDTYQ